MKRLAGERCACCDHSRPGVRTGVGLSSGMAFTPGSLPSAFSATMLHRSVRRTSSIMGEMALSSATICGRAPAAAKHSSSIWRVEKCGASSVMRAPFSSTMRSRLRRASGWSLATISFSSSL